MLLIYITLPYTPCAKLEKDNGEQIKGEEGAESVLISYGNIFDTSREYSVQNG